VDPALCQLGAAPNIVTIEGVAAIDDDVAGLEQRHQHRQFLIHHGRGHHQPDGAWASQAGGQVLQRGRPDGARMQECLDGLRVRVVDHTFVASPRQAPHHVGAHAPQSNHPELHPEPPCL